MWPVSRSAAGCRGGCAGAPAVRSGRHSATMAADLLVSMLAIRMLGNPMAGQPGAGGGAGRPEVIRLGSVRGFVVLDLPGAAVCAGGTRLAPDVTVAEVALLARAMTYKF